MNKTIPLKKNYEFLYVFKRGTFQAGRHMTIYILPNKYRINRLGITASKKVGNSVKRNRIKRLIRENYRQFEDNVKTGYDIVLVARHNKVMPLFEDIRKEMKFLLRRINLLI